MERLPAPGRRVLYRLGMRHVGAGMGMQMGARRAYLGTREMNYGACPSRPSERPQ